MAFVTEAVYKGHNCGYLSLGYFSNPFKWGHTVDANGLQHCAKFGTAKEAEAAGDSYLADRLSFKVKVVPVRYEGGRWHLA